MNYLGAALRRCRRASGLTQESAQVAIFGARSGFLSALETGRRSCPVSWAPYMARVLGESADFWARTIMIDRALRRMPDGAQRMHAALEVLADLYVSGGDPSPQLAHDLKLWIQERMTT